VIKAVFDTGVLVSAIGWRGPARRAFSLAARRRCKLIISQEILIEYETRIPEVLAREVPQANPAGALTWIKAKALLVEPAPLGKQRSRDIKDEKFIAAALSASADVIVSYDDDLLTLEKPFGIPVMLPQHSFVGSRNEVDSTRFDAALTATRAL
jgi:putative PIN family toxin of toxin-antitoxin system